MTTNSERLGPAANRGAIEKRWRHGFLPLTIEEYLTKVDWAARQVILGKSGAMVTSLPPVVERLKRSPTLLMQMVVNFDNWTRTARVAFRDWWRKPSFKVASSSTESAPYVPPKS